jgi:hypothetical protein
VLPRPDMSRRRRRASVLAHTILGVIADVHSTLQRALRSERRSGRLAPAVVVVACSLPFCVGRLVFEPSADGIAGPAWPCPFRALTGLPCPACGATRSVVLFAHGDARFMHYNPWWVAVLLAAWACGLGLLVARSAGLRTARWRDLRRLAGRHQLAAAAVVLIAGWAVALAHVAAITS